jgi:hypothetical protein
MKLIRLITHTYAPELNTAVFLKNDQEYRFGVPGVTRLNDVRRTLFGFKRGVFATVTKTYAERPSLNRTVTGFVCSRAEAIAAARKWIAQLAPGGKVTVLTRLRG